MFFDFLESETLELELMEESMDLLCLFTKFQKEKDQRLKDNEIKAEMHTFFLQAATFLDGGEKWDSWPEKEKKFLFSTEEGKHLLFQAFSGVSGWQEKIKKNDDPRRVFAGEVCKLAKKVYLEEDCTDKFQSFYFFFREVRNVFRRR